MRFGQLLRRGTCAVLILIALSLSSYPAGAQTAEPTAANWPLTLVWQGEFSPDAALVGPSDVAVDAQGNVYVSTQATQGSIKKFDKDGKFVTAWGTVGKGESAFDVAAGITTDAQGNVYIADFRNVRVQKFDSSGKFLMQWATEAPEGPISVGIDAKGNAVVVSAFTHDHYIQKFDSSNKVLNQWGTTGRAEGQFMASGSTGPEDLALDKDGNVYVSDVENNRIQKFDPDGKLLKVFGSPDDPQSTGNGKFIRPRGIAVDDQGNVYISDTNFVQKLDKDGKFLAQWTTHGGPLDRAGLLTADWDGNLYVLARGDIKTTTGATLNVWLLKKFKQS